MKNLPRIFLRVWAILFACAALTVACSKADKDEPKKEEPTTGFTIPESVKQDLNQTIPSDATSAKQISFTANGPWTARITYTKADTWLTVSPDHGDKAGNYTVTITTAANTDPAARAAQVTFNCGGEAFSLNVTQEAAPQTSLSPEQQKEKLEAAGKAFLAEVDLDNWKKTADLVKVFIDFIDGCDLSPVENDIQQVETIVSSTDPDGIPHNIYQYHPAQFTGHYTFDNNVAVRTAGTFDDIQFDFAHDGHTFKVVGSYKESGKSFCSYKDERNEWVEVFDDYGSVTDYTPVLVERREGIIFLPEEVKASVTADGKTEFDVIANLDYNASFDNIEDIMDLDDIKGTIDATLSIAAGDYKVTIGKLHFAPGSDDNLAVSFSRNGKDLVTLEGLLQGLHIDTEVYTEHNEYDYDGDGIIDDSWDARRSEIKYGATNFNLTADVMGLVQVKGFLKFDDIDGLDLDKNTAAELNKELDKMAEFYALNVFFDGDDEAQAWLSFESTDDNGNLDIIPVVCFADGTSYAVEDWFTVERFQTLIDTAETVLEKISDYLDTFFPEESEDDTIFDQGGE